jgi:hypothetical protein
MAPVVWAGIARKCGGLWALLTTRGNESVLDAGKLLRRRHRFRPRLCRASRRSGLAQPEDTGTGLVIRQPSPGCAFER